MGFDISNHNSCQDPAYLANKKSLALRFQDFNYRLLELTLKTLALRQQINKKDSLKVSQLFLIFEYPNLGRSCLLALISLMTLKSDNGEELISV
jgi:hypothetical protein